MNNNTILNLNLVEQHKRDLFTKVKKGELSIQDILSLPISNDENYNNALSKAQQWYRLQLQIDESQQAMKNLGFTSWEQVNSAPQNIKLIKKITFSEDASQYPMQIANTVGDEINIALLDFETTGLSHQSDVIIELGLVMLKYSPSKGIITKIENVISQYSDPGVPISAEITGITGITDADVAGHKIDTAQLAQWLKNENTIIIAHNAKFDRPFFHKLMGTDNYRWGCSASQIKWKDYKEYRIESAKLEYILLKLGYFYEGHRASIDCLAMVQMFVTLPQSLTDLLTRIDQVSHIIEATNAPFSAKDNLKALRFRWNGNKKVWWNEVSESEYEATMQALDNMSNYSRGKATVNSVTAVERFKLS